ncbi:MAG TPA: hypothetical protein VIQ55_12805 [Burkholderiales bacterium]|jgi:hypothetical protein
MAPLATHAAGPLAILGKQLLKEAMQDFLKSQLTSLAQESLGACKSMLAQTGTGAMGAHMMSPLIGQIDPAALARLDPATREKMAQAMAALQAMRSAPPLSAAEADELVDRLVKVSKAIPDHELPCSPQELKLLFGMSASMPMGAGSFRMMLDALRGMDDYSKKVHECFAQMSPAEEEEAIDLIAAEVAGAEPEERKQAAGFLQSDLVGLPMHVREKLRIRLASVR